MFRGCCNIQIIHQWNAAYMFLSNFIRVIYKILFFQDLYRRQSSSGICSLTLWHKDDMVGQSDKKRVLHWLNWSLICHHFFRNVIFDGPTGFRIWLFPSEQWYISDSFSCSTKLDCNLLNLAIVSNEFLQSYAHGIWLLFRHFYGAQITE